MAERRWVGSWSASPQPTWGEDFVFPTKIPAMLRDQTLRQVVRLSLGGSRLRVVLSNEYGSAPLRIGSASVALAGPDTANMPRSLQMLTFGGETAVIVPAGAPLVSDPVPMPVGDAERLAVSLYLPDRKPLTTFHWEGKQTALLGAGDQTTQNAFPVTETTDARLFLSGVLVDTPNDGAVVVFGDSITDGAGASPDADARWPDYLAVRLAPHRVAVLNAGISGARLLQDGMGVNAAARFTRDVLAQPGVRAVILLLGINDIGWPGTDFARAEARPSLDALIAAYRQLIALAHGHNIRIIGGTLTPFEGALPDTPLSDYWNAGKDALRHAVNHWIRTSGAFDGIVDFDALLRDPAHPGRFAAAFDCGDHIHPGDHGHQAMAEAVDLEALLGRNATEFSRQ
jgi:lysophospholipase L1-like esterase